ncbi:MAG: fibronectin type III-like domain-contianing protein, partial [Phenylobacterium sp.]|nr:fibronectin type III-like domain-contianing protein [Phenylobacterium sp.]MBP9755414.1 fibronectin type III-like domain-contianing protein [Phenylobacterium sp.]
TDTPQVYATVTGSDGKPSLRLIGWARVRLEPGETRRVTVAADARLLANYDATLPGWKIAAGSAAVALATSAEDAILHGTAELIAQTMKP